MGEYTGENLVRIENIILDEEYKDFEDMVRTVGSFLVEEGFVHDTWPQAVIDREKKYPTGLETVCLSVGIPHTDREHVKHSIVTVIRPKRPVKFTDMGTGTGEIEAEYVFMLAIKEGEGQLAVLSRLMGIFSNEEILRKLKHSTSREEIAETMISLLNQEG